MSEQTCKTCGAKGDLRPYGKGGALICFSCAMGTPESTREAERRFIAQFDGGKTVVIDSAGPRTATYEEAVMITDIIEQQRKPRDELMAGTRAPLRAGNEV
jgi:hypothetical protein